MDRKLTPRKFHAHVVQYSNPLERRMKEASSIMKTGWTVEKCNNLETTWLTSKRRPWITASFAFLEIDAVSKPLAWNRSIILQSRAIPNIVTVQVCRDLFCEFFMRFGAIYVFLDLLVFGFRVQIFYSLFLRFKFLPQLPLSSSFSLYFHRFSLPITVWCTESHRFEISPQHFVFRFRLNRTTQIHPLQSSEWSFICCNEPVPLLSHNFLK